MKPPLDDLRIRQAISHALDRSDLVTLDPRTGIEGLGTQRGFIGTGLNPNNPTWAMPDDVRQQLVGYGADMEVRRALARDLIADYEADKGPIAPGTFQFQCGTLHVSCEIAVLYQSQLAKVGIDMEITPGDTIEVWFSQVEGNHFMTTFFTTLESDDPGPAMGQQFICTGTHNYHFRCLDELDTIWSAQIFENDESARRQSAWDMNTLAMNDAANLIIYWHLAEHIRRDFIKGWTTRPFPVGRDARKRVHVARQGGVPGDLVGFCPGQRRVEVRATSPSGEVARRVLGACRRTGNGPLPCPEARARRAGR